MCSSEAPRYSTLMLLRMQAYYDGYAMRQREGRSM